MSEKLFFNKVTIIGVGLIGGSLAISLRQKGLAGTIVGVGRGIRNLESAKRLGVVDAVTRDLEEGVKGSELVVVSVPVLKIAGIIRNIMPHLEKGAIVTDVGSVKEAIVREVEPCLRDGVSFVPGHPVAGTEHSGAEAALPDLFENRNCILTPTDATDESALSKISSMWEEAGSNVVMMDPCTHDRVLAAVSHLPHVIAYCLVNTVADIKSDKDILSFSAGGFRDFTRIASSSPEMWADICAMNKTAIVDMIENFRKRLEELKGFIETADLEGLRSDFEKAKKLRDSLVRDCGE